MLDSFHATAAPQTWGDVVEPRVFAGHQPRVVEREERQLLLELDHGEAQLGHGRDQARLQRRFESAMHAIETAA
jgi:hypothetical protein